MSLLAFNYKADEGTTVQEMVMSLSDYLLQLDQQPLGAASSYIHEIMCTYVGARCLSPTVLALLLCRH